MRSACTDKEALMSGIASDQPYSLGREEERDSAPSSPIEPRSRVEQRGPDWTQQGWDDLVPRLRHVAVSRLAHMSWRGCMRGGSPGVIGAEDVVNDAIAKTIAGVRPWRPESCSLFQHLAAVIKQQISHAANSSENRLLVAADGRCDPEAGWPPDIADEGPDQEWTALWRSEQRRLLVYLGTVDPRIARMAELQLDHDLCETRELCVALAATPAEVANLRKRMKRAVGAYLKDVEV
jgi:DNA-directed RNA polymerase specialized sigma24 family protein